MEQLKPCSHMLKHLLDKHEDEDHGEIVFNARVLNYCKSSFDRQVLESVKIQQERGHNLLNSKAEYNRSAVPRLTIKIGEKQYKKWEKEVEKDKEKNEELEGKIRDLRKKRNKERRNPGRVEGPAMKRRKMENDMVEEMKRPKPNRTKPVEEDRKRWKDVGEEEKRDQPPRKKLRQTKIGEKPEETRPRYSEFGHSEEERWEFYDWEGKMAAYEKELKEEEAIRKRKKEKAEKREKGWELMKLCKKYIEENSKEWKDEEESRNIKRDAEEKKIKRLEKAAIEK